MQASNVLAQMFSGLHFRQGRARWIALLAEHHEVASGSCNPAGRAVGIPVIDALFDSWLN
ncbi:hypothetical protein C9I56_32840 [Paraburkholderia caribensis]|nr:hypothetical protein C9I56_32840 [Paraburkholderia caribensis]